MEDVNAKLKPRSLMSSVGCACARLASSSRFASALLVLIIVWELGSLLLSANRKLFWYDELLTLHVSNLHPFARLWQALQAGADGMSPGYYVIIQLASMLPGDPHVTLRLPSILGYILTLVGVYFFTQKRLQEFSGLMAVVLITLTPFRAYAVEARSYCLLVGFLAISAVFWQNIGEKRFMTPLFALALTMSVSFHHLAVVAISSFGVAELTCTLMSRRIRWGVWAACLFATTPFFLSLPILLHCREVFGDNFWSRPSWSMVIDTYKSYYVIDGIKLTFVLIFFFGIVTGESMLRMFRKSRETSLECHFGLPEIILVGSFLLYPALLVVLTKFLGGGYVPRYGLPVIFGLVIGSMYLFHTICLKSYSAHLLGALLIVFAMQACVDFTRLSKAGVSRQDEYWTRLAELSRDEPGIPVVIGSGLRYLEATEYAPPELRNRLVHVVDTDSASRLVGTDSADKLIRILAQFIPLRVEDLGPFQAAHQRFILYSGSGLEWFTQYLVERKYHLKLLSKDADGLVEKKFDSIFIVERPT